MELWITSHVLAERVSLLAKKIEVDIDTETINARKIGRILARLRAALVKSRNSRRWHIRPSDLRRWCVSYGLPLPEGLKAPEAQTGEGVSEQTPLTPQTP